MPLPSAEWVRQNIQQFLVRDEPQPKSTNQLVAEGHQIPQKEKYRPQSAAKELALKIRAYLMEHTYADSEDLREHFNIKGRNLGQAIHCLKKAGEPVEILEMNKKTCRRVYRWCGRSFD